jgi:hydrogenase maturation protease
MVYRMLYADAPLTDPSALPVSNRTLIVGIGNPDREDDGVAWHVLRVLAERLQRSLIEWDGADLDQDDPSPHLVCMLQLTPEVAELLGDYQRVCFVDAHTGAYAEDIRFAAAEPDLQTSPFTHHLTPPACLILAEAMYGYAPRAAVLSVRGHQFGFSNSLSAPTAGLAAEAVERIIAWLAADDEGPS